jgi:hypothetical protein
MPLLLNWNLYKWRTTSRVCYWVFSHSRAYIGVEGSLHRLGKVGLEQMDGTPLGLHCLQASKPSSWTDVETCQPSPGPSWLKPWPPGQRVVSAGWHLGPPGLGFGPLGPCVKYTPMAMLILAFGQLHFVIHWNAPIWYLSSWNQINTKIVELG